MGDGIYNRKLGISNWEMEYIIGSWEYLTGRWNI